ncbi:MAG: DNA-protecting protein DprA [Lewinellaceae bacterium]|nr:DNA-protecting protein DprA [Lewinellaceae bacterium]
MDELLYELALTKIPKVGAKTGRVLLSYCGSARQVFSASAQALSRIPGIGPTLNAAIRSPEPLRKAEAELSLLEQTGVEAISYRNPRYPERFKQIPDAPLVLYLQGNVDLNPSRSIAVVGTRKPSSYGLACCEALIDGLAPYQPLIVSGLAFGIDICAHRRALDRQMPTVAVLGHGLGHLYPAAHQDTARRLRKSGGLLTEYGWHTSPEKEQFPMRNRIVAGLCDALVVVETGERGGSMITAQLASGYYREVFAVPGRLNDPSALGCNLLIRDNMAALITSAEDIARGLRWDDTGIQQQLFVELTPAEKLIVDLLPQTGECGIDDLALQVGKPGSALAATLLDLELKGVIKSLPGKRYRRT